MDIYGIGAAALGAYRAVVCALRGSGRTQRLLELVTAEDLVIFRTSNEAHQFTRLAKSARGIDVHYQVVPATLSGLNQIRARVKGRLHFDHSWVEAYYDDVLVMASERLAWEASQQAKLPPALTRAGTELEARFNATFPPPTWRD